MSRTLSKITAPQAAGAYPRARLFRRLDDARGVVWLSAPAGSGKTTLIRSWLDTRAAPFFWYRSDARDADAANLFYFAKLCFEAKLGRPLPALPLLSAERASLATFARTYFETAFAELDAESVLVIDDYQEAPAGSPWHAAIREAIDVLPESVRIVIASRTDPPPELARALANGAIEVLRRDAIWMTAQETERLARTRLPKAKTTPDALQRLHALTDGWAAGVVLLLEGSGAGSPPHDLATRGTQGVFDYFASEIFEKLDEPTRMLLLRTSILPVLDVATANRLAANTSDVHDAKTVIDRLVGQSFFIEVLGEADSTYRFHPLFREFLSVTAARVLDAAELRRLRIDAGRALADGGYADEAFELFRQAEHFAGCAELLLRLAPSLAAQGRFDSLVARLDELPAAITATHAWLVFWRAMTVLGRDPAKGSELSTTAFRRFVADGDPIGARLAWSLAVQACVHQGSDFWRLDAWLTELEHVEAALALPSPPNEVASRVALGRLLILVFRKPAHVHAGAWTEEALAIARAAETETSSRVMILALLMTYYCFAGDLGHARAILDLLREAGLPETNALEAITRLQGEALFAWMSAEIDACVTASKQGLSQATATGIFVWNDQLAALGMAASLNHGEVRSADGLLRQMAQSSLRAGSFGVGNYEFYASWSASLDGDIPRALASSELALEQADLLGYPLARVLVRLALAPILAQLDRTEDARKHLAEAYALAGETNSDFLTYSVLLVDAALEHLAGNAEQAIGLVERAFTLGRRRGLYNVFSLPPDLLSKLALLALRARREVEYARTFVARHHLRPDDSALEVEAWPWQLEIRAFGGFAIHVNGAPLSTSGKAQKMPLRLLETIVALGGREVSQEELIALVWPDSEGDAGHRVFDTTLHRLRKLLEVRDAIVLHGGRVTLDRRSCRVDVWAFEHAAAAFDRATLKRPPDLDAAEVAAERMLAVYGGPAFGGDDSIPVLVAARRRWHERLTSCLTRTNRDSDLVRLRRVSDL